MNTVIIGMGTLGLLFGDMISSNADREIRYGIRNVK